MYGNSGRMWANPQGNAGGGGGGTPSEINWSDIQSKPLEFEPKAHEHVLEDIKGLKETFDQITELENSISQLESSQVKTVAKKQPDSEGDIFLNKVDVGLGNVLNEKQATKTEFDSAVEQLEGKKVDKEVGKGLSTNDFTNEIKDTYDSATELINTHSKDTEKHLSDADRKAIEEVKEFDSEGLKAQLDKKVDKVEGKELSDVNFTADYEERLKNSVSNVAFKNHTENEVLHVTAETHKTIEQLNAEVPELRELLKSKVSKDEKLVANTEVPVDTVSVKNSVVLKADDPIDNIPDGTIVFMLGDGSHE